MFGHDDCHAQIHAIMLASVHGNRMPNNLDDFPVLFSVDESHGLPTSTEYLADVSPATQLLDNQTNVSEPGLVRVNGQLGRAFIFSQISLENDSGGLTAEPQIFATNFPKRRDFLRPIAEHDGQQAAYAVSQPFPISECTIDILPMKYSLLAAFAPSIIHRLEVLLLSRNLQSGGFGPVNVSDSSLIIEAISAPAAAERTDYNRHEFLGDFILKFCVVLQVLSWHPTWPEGYLHLEKKRLVSNSTLTKAALKLELDHFILTKPFTGRK